jgi:4,5-dihydroxyphthalate decarboxylase
MKLKTLLGDYPVTAALKAGEVTSPGLSFAFADVKVPNTAFKRVVRDLEFDIAELAIMTFLLAKVHGKPLRLLPAVITARFQHALLVYNAARGTLAPEALRGKRVGQRSYSVTTAVWLRGVLASDYGVDLDSVRWVTFEEPHVAEFRDPPNVQHAPAGNDLIGMLLEGELDAAIVGEPPKDDRLRPLIPDPAAAAQRWRQRFGAIQINHMVVARTDVDRSTVDKVFAMLEQSRALAGSPEMNPFGLEANRRNLEVAIDCIHAQGMIPRRLSVEELVA